MPEQYLIACCINIHQLAYVDTVSTISPPLLYRLVATSKAKYDHLEKLKTPTLRDCN